MLLYHLIETAIKKFGNAEKSIINLLIIKTPFTRRLLAKCSAYYFSSFLAVQVQPSIAWQRCYGGT